MSNFWKRALTGTLFVVVMLGGIMWSYWSLTLLFFAIAMLGLNEFYGLFKESDIKPQCWVGLGVGALIFSLFVFYYLLAGEFVFTLMLPFIALIFFVELYRKQSKPFVNIAVTILGIVYVIIPFALWVNYLCPYTAFHNQLIDQLAETFLPAMVYNPHLLLGFFFLMWTNDTGAYLTGMAIGKHKLWERISPKKTWEGFFGGVLLSIVVAFIISKYYYDINLVIWVALAIIVSIFGTLGDLVESLLKRSINIKESGALLPGHGGILDRFDGVLLATPFVLAFLQIVHIIATILNG